MLIQNEDSCKFERKEEFKINKEYQELKALCIDLLNAVEQISYCPYYMVKPFLKVIEKYKEIITKYNLNKE